MRRQLLSIALIILVVIGSVSRSLIASNQPISPTALYEQIEAQSAPTILDVRSNSEYEAGHVPGAIHIEYRQLPQRLSELPVAKGQPIVVYCETGVRAAIANTTLTTAGYKPILQLTGHMKGWRAKGLPVDKGMR
ncbi:MAG: rhodanese-like domain-containing protein [Thermosynechococcaceae cyanobacterium]